MKLCLISSWMQTSQIDTHGETKETKLRNEHRLHTQTQTVSKFPTINQNEENIRAPNVLQSCSFSEVLELLTDLNENFCQYLTIRGI